MQARSIVLLAMMAATALYWSGLSGPFIFDDPWNLEPIRLWLDGQASIRGTIFPQASLIFSRPVAMASFMLTSWLWGDTTFSFKLGNLVVHLVCGLLGWRVLRRALMRDGRIAASAEWWAALAAALWLLHPLHVSTVLYAVQRMAQLSTLFTLAAVWIYLIARQQLIDGRARTGSFNLFVSFPLLVVLGVLSKQNAVVAPALCMVLELAYFTRQHRTGRSIPLFFCLFLALPALGGLTLLLFAPDKLLGTYAEWDFTLFERMLTQTRVLMDYIGMLLVPRGPLMGLYTDDFVISTGLFSPLSTLWSLIALSGISVAAVALRTRAPSVFAGWFFFLAAHSVESTILPLEMYYEHRNYLPSFGLALAVCGLFALWPPFRTDTISPRKLGLAAAAAFAIVLCFATLGRVLVWQDMGNIVQLGVKTHPDSLRARFDLAAWALSRKDHRMAEDAMRYLIASDNPRHRQLGSLSLVTTQCMRGVDTGNLELLQAAAAANLPKLTTFEAQAFVRISGATRTAGCGKLSRGTIAHYLQQILDSAASQPETASPKWFSRYALAEIYARDGQWQRSQSQAELAWFGGRDKKVGVFLATIYLENGRMEEALQMVGELERIVEPYDLQGREILNNVKAAARAHKQTENSSVDTITEGVTVLQ